MATPDEIAETADRFSAIAYQFCSVVDSGSSMKRAELLQKIYRILPALIGEAIALPDLDLRNDDDQTLELNQPAPRAKVRLSQQQWDRLYNLLKEQLGDWDLYHQVFDPTEDTEATFGSLADDIADIYRDLKEGLVLSETHQAPPGDIVWEWRLGFYSHWGKHAMDALLTIHFRLQNAVSE